MYILVYEYTANLDVTQCTMTEVVGDKIAEQQQLETMFVSTEKDPSRAKTLEQSPFEMAALKHLVKFKQTDEKE
ncbi:hypothetical protein FQA39_LY00413 [Lamprigera yunnana]|nr:hypothetical protein FQA39_LY00413 [Lamprigera yunnana]